MLGCLLVFPGITGLLLVFQGGFIADIVSSELIYLGLFLVLFVLSLWRAIRRALSATKLK